MNSLMVRFPMSTYLEAVGLLKGNGKLDIMSIKVGFELLKPEGWYFEAGWEREQFETPPMEWMLQR